MCSQELKPAVLSFIRRPFHCNCKGSVLCVSVFGVMGRGGGTKGLSNGSIVSKAFDLMST